MRSGLLDRSTIHAKQFRLGFIVTAIVLSLALVGCKDGDVADKLHLAREAAQAVFNVVCELPPDHVIRVRIREAVAGAAGLNTSRVCEDGLNSLLDNKQAASAVETISSQYGFSDFAE